MFPPRPALLIVRDVSDKQDSDDEFRHKEYVRHLTAVDARVTSSGCA